MSRQMNFKSAVQSAKQKGFTLLELIIVVIIIGILAAVAVPQFFDLAKEAKVSALKGTAANLSSAATINYGAFQSNVSGAINADTCEKVATLVKPPLGSEYTVAAVGAGECKVTHSGLEAPDNVVNFAAPGVQ